MKRRASCFFAILFLSVILAGCGNSKEGTKEVTRTDTPPTQEVPAAGEKTEEIDIYTINETSLELEDVKAVVSYEGELAPGTVVDAVADSFFEHGIEIGIDHVEMEGDMVIVSFTGEEKGKAPLCNTGSGVEGVILDAVSQSLLDNIDSCKEVVFRIEDRAYESGVFAFDYDQAYKWK